VIKSELQVMKRISPKRKGRRKSIKPMKKKPLRFDNTRKSFSKINHTLIQRST